jgi:PPOX class probable F420-dependent enzyme
MYLSATGRQKRYCGEDFWLKLPHASPLGLKPCGLRRAKALLCHIVAALPASHRDLLRTDVAVLATIGPDGYPQLTALWFLADDAAMVRLSLNTSRQTVRSLQQHPECTLFLLDPASPYRTLEIRARAEIQPDPEYAFADNLGQKYRANLRQNDRPGESRAVVTLHPVKVNT